MQYREIDLEHWARKEHYLHFTKEVNCTCCMTSDLDVTGLSSACKAADRSFYVALLYCVCKVINAHEEFRMAYLWQEKKLILWDQVVPSHLVFHSGSETFTRIWSDWHPDFIKFYTDCRRDMEAGRRTMGCSVPHVPKNIFDVSCIPWRNYSAMSLHIPENWIYLAPIITWGKFTEKNHRMLLPMTMQIHHAAADGFHITRFFNEVEQAAKILADSLSA
ncbi:MAG: chloramphenicol acetyltransferase [Oscillospiraceae bacterium]|nr:chloramphenicol acetyltransferase [Oscillospiraceae bacterium]